MYWGLGIGKVDSVWRSCFGRAVLPHQLHVLWLSTCSGNINSQKLLFDEVKGLCPPGRPRSTFDDVALHDCQHLSPART